jgi:pre-mRNA-splicing factor CWC26
MLTKLYPRLTSTMSLADYLAKNYLEADKPKKSKKRKRKTVEEEGLVEIDETPTSFENPKKKSGGDGDEFIPQIAGQTVARPNARWKTVGVAAPSNKDQLQADAVLQSAMDERRKQAADDDEGPVVEDTQGIGESAGLFGLKTGDEVAAHLAKKREKEMRQYREDEASGALGPEGQETIYRDATGRVINIAKARAEEQRRKEAAERQKREEAEAAKGDAQRRMKDEAASSLREAKYMTVARRADDVDMNEELKEQERWNDPALGFLSKKKGRKSASGRPMYKGSFEPNRYGIRPGYRWDGVDRSNGFERKWFAARNKRRDREALEYAWQMDE